MPSQLPIDVQPIPLFALSDRHPHPSAPRVIWAWWTSSTGYEVDVNTPKEAAAATTGWRDASQIASCTGRLPSRLWAFLSRGRSFLPGPLPPSRPTSHNFAIWCEWAEGALIQRKQTSWMTSVQLGLLRCQLFVGLMTNRCPPDYTSPFQLLGYTFATSHPPGDSASPWLIGTLLSVLRHSGYSVSRGLSAAS